MVRPEREEEEEEEEEDEGMMLLSHVRSRARTRGKRARPSSEEEEDDIGDADMAEDMEEVMPRRGARPRPSRAQDDEDDDFIVEDYSSVSASSSASVRVRGLMTATATATPTPTPPLLLTAAQVPPGTDGALMQSGSRHIGAGLASSSSSGSGSGSSSSSSSHMPPTTPTLDAISSKTRDFTITLEKTDCIAALQELVTRWLQYPREFCEPGMSRLVEVAFLLYHFQPGTHPKEEDIKLREEHYMTQAMHLYYRLVWEKVIIRDHEESMVHNELVRVLETMHTIAEVVRLHAKTRLLVEQTAPPNSSMAIQKWQMALNESNGAVDTEEQESKYQKFLLYLLKTAYTQNLRKYNGRLYKQVVVSEPGFEPYRTHAWVQESSMADFVYGVVQKERNYEMWLNMTASHANPREAIKHLENCKDFDLPVLKPNRHVFSFRNCVYDADSDIVYAFADPECAIPDSLVAAKYFPIDFPIEYASPDVNWRDIPTPKLDSILTHQKIPHEPQAVKKKVRTQNADGTTSVQLVDDLQAPRLSAMDWFYVFIGRMIYEIHEYDDWQVLLFIKGVAGSGKSTLGKLVSYMYDANDVGVLSNNTEKKFGLSALVEKLIYVCYEVKNDFQLDQGEFQCMVSGEQMSIPFKHEMAQSVTWKTHGMFMGNEVASWCDNSGSMSRRIVLGVFREMVTEGNPKLFAELQAEIGYTLLKSNLAYREAAHWFGEKDIWNVLPEYFWNNRRALRAETHALAYFFEQSSELHWEEGNAYMLINDLKTMMDIFLAADGTFKTQRKGFTTDFYQWVMDAYHLRVENDTRMYKGQMTPGTYVTGVCDKKCKHFITGSSNSGGDDGGDEYE